ncbi:hypothetical protein P7K49_038130, partial [Saguinus oedipus]
MPPPTTTTSHLLLMALAPFQAALVPAAPVSGPRSQPCLPASPPACQPACRALPPRTSASASRYITRPGSRDAQPRPPARLRAGRVQHRATAPTRSSAAQAGGGR